MSTVIAHVPSLEHPVIRRLVLQVEGPVLCVRQFVVDVITAIEKRTKKIAGGPASRVTASSLLKVRQVCEECCSGSWRRRWQSGAEWLIERGVFRDRDWLHERR